MKQSLFILHSLNGNTEYSFKDSLTETASKLGFKVFYPVFETSEKSSYANFKNVMLSKYKKYIDKDTIIVAHSISANYLIKYVYEFSLSLKALISVGGAIELSSMEIKENNYNTEIKKNSLPNLKEIDYAKTHIKKILLYYSDNDHHSTQEMFENFIKTLNAEPVFCEGYGHFTKKHNVTDLPGIEDILKKLKI